MRNKMKASEGFYEYFFLLFASVTFIDRISKMFLKDGCFYELCVKKTANYGAAFGIFPGMLWFFVTIAIVVLMILVIYIQRVDKTSQIAFTLIAGGTAANLIDRIFFGHVIDIFTVFESSVFNIADLSNVIGAILLIIVLVRNKN